MFDQIARLERPVALPGFLNCTACVTVVDARPESEGDRERGPRPPSRSWVTGAWEFTNKQPFLMFMPEHAMSLGIPRIWIIATNSDQQRDALVAKLNKEFQDPPSPVLMQHVRMDQGEPSASPVSTIYSDRVSAGPDRSGPHDRDFYFIRSPAGVVMMRAALKRLMDEQDTADDVWDAAFE